MLPSLSAARIHCDEVWEVSFIVRLPSGTSMIEHSLVLDPSIRKDTHIMAKTTSTTVATVGETAVEEKLSPAALAERQAEEMRPTVLVVDDESRAQIVKEAAQAEAVVAFLVEKGNVAGTQMLNAQMRLRRLFPASEKVREILGDDACDLIGGTAEYKAAIGEVNAEAFKALVSRLKRDGYGKDVAEATAKTRMDTVRKSVSLAYRRYVENVALNATDGDEKAAAALLLAHGFQHHTAIETKKVPQLIRPGQTVEVAENTKQEGVRLVNGRALLVKNPTPKAGDKTEANEPKEQSDQATPTQTAEAEIAAAAKAVEETLTNPASRLNFAIGEVRTAAQDKRITDMSSAEGRGHLVNLLAVVSEAILAIGPNLTAKDRNTVASKLQAMGATALVAIELASK